MPVDVRFILSLVCLGLLAALTILAAVGALVSRSNRDTEAACPHCGRRVARFTEQCPGCGRSLMEDE